MPRAILVSARGSLLLPLGWFRQNSFTDAVTLPQTQRRNENAPLSQCPRRDRCASAGSADAHRRPAIQLRLRESKDRTCVIDAGPQPVHWQLHGACLPISSTRSVTASSRACGWFVATTIMNLSLSVPVRYRKALRAFRASSENCSVRRRRRKASASSTKSSRPRRELCDQSKRRWSSVTASLPGRKQEELRGGYTGCQASLGRLLPLHSLRCPSYVCFESPGRFTRKVLCALSQSTCQQRVQTSVPQDRLIVVIARGRSASFAPRSERQGCKQGCDRVTHPKVRCRRPS
eukprot:scaffold90_cov264-Pinguiococcus_pyrenoidosus.AAC.23